MARRPARFGALSIIICILDDEILRPKALRVMAASLTVA